MGQLDIAAKALLDEAPADLVELALRARVREVRPLDTTLPASAWTLDKLLEVELEGASAPLVLHLEVQARWASELPRRVFEYWSLAHRRHDDVWSVVICLRRGKKQGRPRRSYRRRVRGRRALRFEFDVLALWEVDAEQVLSGGREGLLPLLPFLRGATPDQVERALATLEPIEPVRRRGELQAALVVFAEHVFPDVAWADRMPQEVLMGSTIYQLGERDGLLAGQRAGELAGRLVGQRELLRLILTERLGDGAEPLIQRLEGANAEELTRAGLLLGRSSSDADLLVELEATLPPLKPDTPSR